MVILDVAVYQLQTFDCKADRLPALTAYCSVHNIYSKFSFAIAACGDWGAAPRSCM